HYLQVGDREFSCSSGLYEAAPEAGYVRLYYLPLSRHIASFEPLKDAPLPAEGVSLQNLATSAGAILKAKSARERNEARAQVAGMANVLKSAFAAPEGAPSPE